MKKKKILIISYSYPPANVPAAQRPYSIAKYLDKNKFDVTVLTCGNQDSSLGFDNTKDETLKDVHLIKINGFKVAIKRNVISTNTAQKTGITIKIKQLIFKFLSYFLIPDKAILWYPSVLKYIKNDQNKYDIIFSTSPAFTNHLVALKVKKKNSDSTYIADIRDYHYLANEQNKKGLKAAINKILEKKIIHKADKITVISDAMKKEYQTYYKSYANKIYSIYNGFDADEYKIKSINNFSDKLSIFYAGSFYKGVRNPMPLFNIIEELITQQLVNTSNLQIEIAGNFENELINELKPMQVFKYIHFLGQLPRNEVLKKYKESDLLWLIVGNKIAHYTGVPIKFYEYLASQRPILNFAPNKSEPTKIISELKLGWNFDTTNQNFEDNVAQFKEILNLHKANKLRSFIKETTTQKYSRINQTKKLEKLF